MDLSNSVILPREDFIELQTVAWNQPPPPFKDRASSVAQTTIVFAIVASAVTAGTWGWASAMNWYEKKHLEREIKRAAEATRNTTK